MYGCAFPDYGRTGQVTLQRLYFFADILKTRAGGGPAGIKATPVILNYNTKTAFVQHKLDDRIICARMFHDILYQFLYNAVDKQFRILRHRFFYIVLQRYL